MWGVVSFLAAIAYGGDTEQKGHTVKTFTADTRPRCVAWVHPTMGSMTTCKKFADWLVSGVPNRYNNDAMPVCRDCVAKVLINSGDAIDNITFDTVLVVKS